jgi:hypothetical protein
MMLGILGNLRREALENFTKFYLRNTNITGNSVHWYRDFHIFIESNGIEESNRRIRILAGPNYYAYLRAAELTNPNLRLRLSKSYIKKVKRMRKLER